MLSKMDRTGGSAQGSRSIKLTFRCSRALAACTGDASSQLPIMEMTAEARPPECDRESLTRKCSCDSRVAESVRDDSALNNETTSGANASRDVELWALLPLNVSSWAPVSGHALIGMFNTTDMSLNGGVSKMRNCRSATPENAEMAKANQCTIFQAEKFRMRSLKNW